MTSVRSLYEPIAEDLELVEDALQLVTRSDFAPLQSMLEQVLQRSGKRLRPAIALLAGGFGDYATDNQVGLAASVELLQRNPHPTAEQVRDGLEGNVCRCTGYHNIVKSVLAAAEAMGGRP